MENSGQGLICGGHTPDGLAREGLLRQMQNVEVGSDMDNPFGKDHWGSGTEKAGWLQGWCHLWRGEAGLNSLLHLGL